MADALEILNEKLPPGKDPVAREVFALLDHYRRFRQRFEDQWETNFENATVTPFGTGAYTSNTSNPLGFARLFNQRSAVSGRRALKTPESAQMVKILLAIIVGALLGGDKVVAARPKGFASINKADTATDLMENVFLNPENWAAIYMAAKDCLIAGAGFVRAPWINDIRHGELIRTPAIDPQSGLPVPGATTFTRGSRVIRQDAGFYYCDLFDVYVDPSSDMLKNSLGTIEHFVITANDALAATEPKAEGIRPSFTFNAVKEAIAQGSATYMQNADPNAIREVYGLDRDVTLPFDRYIPLEGWRFKGEVWWKPADGIRHRIITILNGVTVQDDPYPYIELDGSRTDLEVIRTDLIGGVFYPQSPLTQTKYLQDVSDHTLMLWVDAVTRGLHNIVMVGGGAGVTNVNKLRSAQSGDVVLIPGDIEQIAPMPFTNALSNGPQLLMDLSMRMRESQGAGNPVQGILSQGDKTATEISAVTQSAMSIVEMMATVIEHTFLPSLASKAFSRYLQFMPDEGMIVKRVGEGKTYPIEWGDIDGQFDFEWRSARSELTKGQRAAAMQKLWSILAIFPQLAQRYKAYPMALQYAMDQGFPQAYRFIATDAELAQQQAEIAGAQAAANPAGAGVGSPAAPAGEVTGAPSGGALTAMSGGGPIGG